MSTEEEALATDEKRVRPRQVLLTKLRTSAETKEGVIVEARMGGSARADYLDELLDILETDKVNIDMLIIDVCYFPDSYGATSPGELATNRFVAWLANTKCVRGIKLRDVRDIDLETLDDRRQIQ